MVRRYDFVDMKSYIIKYNKILVLKIFIENLYEKLKILNLCFFIDLFVSIMVWGWLVDLLVKLNVL